MRATHDHRLLGPRADSLPGRLTVRRDDVPGTTVVRAVGEIDLATLPIWRRALTDALADGTDPIVVDLARVRFLASCGVLALIEANDAANAGGRPIRLAAANRVVTTILGITRVDAVVPCHHTVAAAIAAHDRAATGGASTPGEARDAAEVLRAHLQSMPAPLVGTGPRPTPP